MKIEKFIELELSAIYEEFETNVYNLMKLKPFIEDIIQVSKGKDPNYRIHEINHSPKIKKNGLKKF